MTLGIYIQMPVVCYNCYEVPKMDLTQICSSNVGSYMPGPVTSRFIILYFFSECMKFVWDHLFAPPQIDAKIAYEFIWIFCCTSLFQIVIFVVTFTYSGLYIHNWWLQPNPSVKIIDLVSHTLTLYVLILYISGGIYSLKTTPNDRFFWETFHGNFIYSQSFCQKSAERK